MRTPLLYLVWIFLFALVSPCGSSVSAIELTAGEKAWIQSGQTVRVRVGSWPPFILTHGEIEGMAIDYLAHFFETNGIQYEFIPPGKVTWPEALEYIKVHRVVDMVPTAKITEERKKNMLFTNEYIFAPWVIFTRSNGDFVGSIDDLRGKTVSVEEGFVMHQVLAKHYPDIKLKVVPAHMKEYAHIPIKDLSTGLVDAYIGNLLTTTYLIQNKGYTNVKVAAPTPFGNHNQAMAIRSDWPELVGIINKTLASMTTEDHAAIRNKWLSIRYEYGIDKAQVALWVLGVVGISSFIVGFVLFLNKRLKTEVVLRTKVEQELKRQRDVFELVINSVPARIFWKDLDLVYLGCNIHFAKDSGMETPEDVTGKSDHDLVWKADADIHRADDNQVIRTGQPKLMYEEPFFNKEGEKVWWLTNKMPLRNHDGDIIGVIATSENITERKRAEKEKQRLEARLQHVQKLEAMGRLAGGIAHDYNNISSIIIGYSELVLEQIKAGDPFHEDLVEILTAAKRSAEITKQLLAFARKQTIDPKVVDLNHTIGRILKMLMRLIGEDIDLVWRPGPELWVVKIDPSQVDQIVANIGLNARDAIADVGKITMETENVRFDEAYCETHAGFIPGEYILLAISDDGCGMAPEIMDKIFDPFFTTKGVGQGTGLGLSTVYGIVRQNNGFINVYSEPDMGTIIRIYLPRYKGNGVEIHWERTPIAPLGRGETVLLVEDDEAILKLGKRMLEELGYRVLHSAGPGEAVALAGGHTGELDLLITDVIMPEMNGRELSEKLKQICGDLKVLFMSGYTANVIAHRGVLDHDVFFIPKPFSKKELAVKVREVLDGEAV